MIRRELKAPELVRIKAAWLAGISLNDIAAEHDASPALVYYHVKAIKRDNAPKRGPKAALKPETARRLRAHGMTYEEIAYRLGVSRTTAWRAVQEVRHAA